ncbi:MAG TPA: hypothetical protein VMW38_23185 [Terriglobia bacterium]|nr:hypothetical protein [Terriglobia bacterium]
MKGNALLGFISIILACSPFLARNAYFDNFFRINSFPHTRNNLEVMVVSLGCLGLALSLYYLFIKKKNGSLHIVIGILILLVGFFYNQEKFPLPNRNNLLGGEMFFMLVMSFVLTVTGVIVEWLLD